MIRHRVREKCGVGSSKKGMNKQQSGRGKKRIEGDWPVRRRECGVVIKGGGNT